jgi:hypothetical protein
MNETGLIRTKVIPYLKTCLPRAKFTKLVGTPYSEGLPDIMGCWEGHLILIEVKKAENRKPSALQKQLLLDFAQVGAMTCLFILENDKTFTVHYPEATLPFLRHSDLSVKQGCSLEECQVKAKAPSPASAKFRMSL